jgi:DNA-binding transcriptional regulator GbsR (MarR family)
MKTELAINTKEKTMTTKELAEVLGVSVDTVSRAASKVLEPSAVLRRVVNGGNSKVYTEEQATLIKQEIQKHHNLASRQIDNATTILEKQMVIAQAIQYSNEIIAMLQAENSTLKEDNENLQIELDQSKEYITIKRMEKLNPKHHFNWRLLKRESERLHKPSKETFDQNYGTVKAYHVDVWESLYFDSINYPM